MALARFFITFPGEHEALNSGLSFSLAFDGGVHHHVANVLRLHEGERLEIVQRGLWNVWLCEVEQVDAGDLVLRVIEEIPSAQQSFETTLVLGFSKGDTNEKVVRQATELGVACIVPVIFSRSISRPDAKRVASKVERLRKIAVSAAQQAHRSDLPIIENVMTFEDASGFLTKLSPDLVLTPWEEESGNSLAQQIALTDLPECPSVAVIIGPEGGISGEEIAQLETIGAKSVSLGLTILRVDTAAVAALAVVHAALEDR